jgi:hypothetical protein
VPGAPKEVAVTIPVAIFVGLVGWCGTPPLPRPPGPRDPLAGIIGGLAGGFLVFWALDLQAVTSAVDLIAVAIGAFAGGRVLSRAVDWVVPEKPRA